MSSASAWTCPECGTALPADARRGLCPACLLRRALEPDPEEGSSSTSSTGSIRLVLADGTTAPPPCSRIGDYDLLEEIGHGGMGVIYKARQRSLDRVVAVKLIRAGLQARAGDVARFQTEAAAAARLQHPNIVGIYEVGEEAGQRFYSMEFVPGSSLAGALRAGPFEPKQAARQASIIAEAIQYAHERGVLHRDLKPSNILLDERDEPRVADFGLAKLMQGDSELTVSGAVIGSPQYMPPEQARGSSAKAGVTSDVYSLGAILYELLTGRPPFSAATPLETMKLVVEQEPIAPRALNPSLPRDLETICLKCLAKEPVGRYASARELADELGRFLRDEPIRARPVSLVERGWRWCRRKPALATLGAMLIAAPATIVALLLLTGARIQREKWVTEENLYAADIALAAQAIETKDYGIADRSLEAHLPGFAGKGTTNGHLPSNQNSDLDSKDLRGFEWRFLWAQAQGDALRTISAHLSEVNDIIYSPDGRFVASSSPDGTAKLWDAGSGEFQRLFQEPGNRFPLREFTGQYYQLTNGFCLRTVAFSADGRELLTAGDQGISAWEPGTGRQLWHLRIGTGSPTNIFTMLLASPADPNLALGTMYASRSACGLINLSNQSVAALFTNGRTDRVCFTPDGRQFARWDANAKCVWVQQIPSGATNAVIETREMHVSEMEFTPDGRILAACNLNRGRIELFDVASQQPAGQLTGQLGRLQMLAISPNGKLLASGGYDHTIRLCDLAAHRELRQLRGHRSPIRTLAFSPDSEHLVSGGYDGTVRFWDIAPAPPPPEITNVFGAFMFSPDGHWVVTQTAEATARLFELPGRRLAAEWSTPPFQSAVFTAGGDLLLASQGSSNAPPCVRAWNCRELAGQSPLTSTGKPLPRFSSVQFQGLSSPCSALGLSPSGETLVTGCRDGTVAFWEARSGVLRRRSRRESQPPDAMAKITSVHFATNGRLVVTASMGAESVQIWSLPDCEPQASRHLGEAALCALSPNGQQLATAGLRQAFNINLWDADLRGPATQLLGHRDYLDALAYAPDGRTLATAGEDGLLKLWHLASRREIVRLVALGQGDYFNALEFSADGTWLGACDNTGRLHLFHAPPLAERDAVTIAPGAGR